MTGMPGMWLKAPKKENPALAGVGGGRSMISCVQVGGVEVGTGALSTGLAGPWKALSGLPETQKRTEGQSRRGYSWEARCVSCVFIFSQIPKFCISIPTSWANPQVCPASWQDT